MKIERIIVGEDRTPTEVTLTIPILELANVTRLLGRQSKDTHRMHGTDSDTLDALWEALMAGVFDRYWAEGTDEALTDDGHEILRREG